MSSQRVSKSEQPEEPEFDSTRELLERYEPLRPELHSYLEQTRFGFFIRHTFCNTSVVDLDRCALIHHTIDEQTAKADACFESQDWEGYIGCVEIYRQPEWLAKDADLLPDDRYWDLLGRVYQSQKFTHYSRDVFDKCFRSQRPGRENLMEPGERALLARLPEQFTVYRGFWDEEGFEDGNAWTLDSRAAVWYANWCWTEECADPAIVRGVVKREDILAFWDNETVIVPRGTVKPLKFRRARCKKARVRWNEYVAPPFDIEAFLGDR
jgi:hypothetical protein